MSGRLALALLPGLAGLTLLLIPACTEPGGVGASALTWREVPASEVTAAETERAGAAKGAMMQRLMAELGQAMGRGGPSQGIRVCKDRAPEIAATVSKEHDLKIGRTSFRLRNPSNAPPTWARDAVARKVATPTFFRAEENRLGALYPITLGKLCLTCHGPREELAEEVVAALSAHYPEDAATGFAEGDLRGWFWVELLP